MTIYLSVIQAHFNLTLRSYFMTVITYKQSSRYQKITVYQESPINKGNNTVRKTAQNSFLFLILMEAMLFSLLHTKPILSQDAKMRSWLNESDHFACVHHQNQSIKSLQSMNYRKIFNHPCNPNEIWLASFGSKTRST